MKKTTWIIFLTLGFLQTQAQDYLIGFEGTGATTSVGSVKVDNLTKMTTVTLNGTDMLHLIASLGIEDQEMHNNSLHIFPNPMADESMLTFVAPENGNVTIGIVDLSGKTVYQINTVLLSGTHSFRVTGIRKGMYFLKVAGKNYLYSSKLISQSKLECAAKIAYVSFDKLNTVNQLKSTAATIDMQYTNGDQLLYKGISGIYSTIVTDVPTSSKTTTFNFVACTDADGNNYSTVQIGSSGKTATQTWMAENLNVGARIDIPNNQTNNSIIEKYCLYNDEAYCAIFGGLYQWDEAMQFSATEGVQGICPSGWHLPTDAEWITLADLLGGDTVAGGKMKEAGTSHWWLPNTGATNSSGFTALPGDNTHSFGSFWSSSQYNDNVSRSWYRHLTAQWKYLGRFTNLTINPLSCRCVKD